MKGKSVYEYIITKEEKGEWEEMALIKANNVMLNYEIRGDGPKLLFIHGIGADLNNPISIFKTKVPEHFTVLAFDPRGLGKSDKPDGAFSIADMADDATGLTDALGWDNYHLLGASMGGMVAQELAIRYPQKVNKLVLASTHAGGNNGAPIVIDKLDKMTTLEKLHISDTRQDRTWAEANPEMVATFEEQSKVAMEAMISNPELVKGYQQQVEAVLGHDTYDRLHLIKAQTLVVSGLYDGSIPTIVPKRMQQRIPAARLKMVEHGHGSWYYDIEVWETIIKFLK